MNIWKTTYPKEDWSELRVAVIGFHQPRESYALKLFFQWLLEEPEVEKRVVYAEYQFSIFGKNKEQAENLAIELLSKVDFEKEASLFLLGDETLLQKDVMGPSTEEILKKWGRFQLVQSEKLIWEYKNTINANDQSLIKFQITMDVFNGNSRLQDHIMYAKESPCREKEARVVKHRPTSPNLAVAPFYFSFYLLVLF